MAGGTDPSKPLCWAKEQNKQFDAFLILTDCAKFSHTDVIKEKLKEYRKALNIPDAR